MATSASLPSAPPAVAAEASRLDVMNFLNEIAGRYPQAISLASGRPAEAFFDVQDQARRIPEYVGYLQAARGGDFDATWNLLAQYGPTNGLINDLVAAQLALDEGVSCAPSQVLVTAGCQEAMALCATTLCPQADDVLLVRSPTYIGITGIADLNGIELAAFSCAPGDSIVRALADSVAAVERRGKRPRALYLVPDFDNPTGVVLTRAEREQIIGFCAARRIVVLEDNPYGMFRFDGAPVPRMAALDGAGCVVYLGTYAKTLCPALRVGFAVVPSALFGDPGGSADLLAALSRAKSFATVNTSQFAQAIVGGILLAEGGSLARRIAPAIEFYRRNRDAMTDALAAAFAPGDGVHWNRPEGGFFMTVSLPFEFGRDQAQCCANDYGVLTMPLSFFALDHAEDRRVRLAFSNSDPDRIRAGVARFARFVHDQLASGAAASARPQAVRQGAAA